MNTEIKYAGFWIRFFAFIIDMIVLIIITLPLTFLGLSEEVIDWTSMLISVLYFVIFTSSVYQATPGKQLLKIKICSDRFERITIARSFLRCVLPLAFFGGTSALMAMFSIDVATSIAGKTAEGYDVSDYERGIATIQVTGLLIIHLLSLLIWYGMAGWTKQKTALHDKICKTRVIYQTFPNLFYSPKKTGIVQ